MARTRGTPLLPGTNLFDMAGILHLSVEEYAAAIVNHGNSGEWRKAMVCPCARPDTNTPRIDCSSCKGMGYTYPEAMRCPMLFLDVTRSMTQKYGQPGVLTDGNITITLPPGFIPGLGDMFLPDYEVHVVQERLWRNATERVDDRMRRPFRIDREVPQRAAPRRERLLYPETECIEQVAYMDADDKLVLADPSSYRVDDEGRWEWLRGGPEPGHSWTVRYHGPGAYVVQGSAPVFRHEADVTMPYRVGAKRLDRLAADDLR